MSEIIFLSNARLSFPHLVEPQKHVNEVTGATRLAYNADFILEPTNPSVQQFFARYQEMAAAKWTEHANNVMQLIQNDRKLRCYAYDVDKIDKKTFKPYVGYVGMFAIAASRDSPPQMIQSDGTPTDPANTMAYQALARKMYGGCYVNAAIKPWLQENKHGRGIRCDLVAVQFLRDGTPFGDAVVDASGMFGAVAGAPTAFAPAPSPGFMPSFLA